MMNGILQHTNNKCVLFLAGTVFDHLTEDIDFNGKSAKEWADDGVDKLIDLFE